MINNYTKLSSGSKTWLKKQKPDVVGNAPNTNGKMETWLAFILLPLLFLFSYFLFQRQMPRAVVMQVYAVFILLRTVQKCTNQKKEGKMV